jgi:diacylglycerol kinase family enzyme
VDDRKFVRRAFLITFANASQWGNNAYIAPLAHMSDGKLDVVVVKDLPRVAMPFLLPRLFTKSIHKSPYIEMFRGRHVVVERPHADYVHFDGEPCIMGKDLDIQIVPLALKVII